MNMLYKQDTRETFIILVFLLGQDNYSLLAPINLSTGSITDSINKYTENSLKILSTQTTLREVDNMFIKMSVDRSDEYTEMIEKAARMVLYICSENAEYEQYRPHKTHRGPQITDKAEEVREWIVGKRIGKRIRKFKEERCMMNSKYGLSNNTRKGGTKSPHMRRGHYHHYWRGPKDGSKERELILRWLEPTFVCGKVASAVSEIHLDEKEVA